MTMGAISAVPSGKPFWPFSMATTHGQDNRIHDTMHATSSTARQGLVVFPAYNGAMKDDATTSDLIHISMCIAGQLRRFK